MPHNPSSSVPGSATPTNYNNPVLLAHQRNNQLSNPAGAWSSRFSDNTSTTTTRQPPSSATHTTSSSALPPPLQYAHNIDHHGLAPLPEDSGIDPDSFDLAAPPPPADSDYYGARSGQPQQAYLEPLERRCALLFSRTHLRIVVSDLRLLRRFGVFLMEHRPQHVPLLVYHLDARKALLAVRYANAVAGTLARRVDDGVAGSAGSEGERARLAFTNEPVGGVENEGLLRKAEESFRVLADEDLPAWVTSVWMRAVEVSIRRRINGSLPTQLRE